MSEKSIFTHEYVETLLSPYLGKNLRMFSKFEDQELEVPFQLENSMESPFQIEFTNLGIRFFLMDNFYLNRDLSGTLRAAISDSEIFAFRLDDISDLETPEDKKGMDYIFERIVSYLEKNLKIQIATTYYAAIKTLKVGENFFVINGIKFMVVR